MTCVKKKRSRRQDETGRDSTPGQPVRRRARRTGRRRIRRRDLVEALLQIGQLSAQRLVPLRQSPRLFLGQRRRTLASHLLDHRRDGIPAPDLRRFANFVQRADDLRKAAHVLVDDRCETGGLVLPDPVRAEELRIPRVLKVAHRVRLIGVGRRQPTGRDLRGNNPHGQLDGHGLVPLAKDERAHRNGTEQHEQHCHQHVDATQP